MLRKGKNFEEYTNEKRMKVVQIYRLLIDVLTAIRIEIVIRKKVVLFIKKMNRNDLISVFLNFLRKLYFW
ncbi:hypothetical protein QFZ73_000324 [Peribacillus sp. V2I11]|nr:hypothetical protein [Peribacillus sp. V2I11]